MEPSLQWTPSYFLIFHALSYVLLLFIWSFLLPLMMYIMNVLVLSEIILIGSPWQLTKWQNQGRSFSYGCYGFGHTTFQPIKWQSIIQSINLCKLGPASSHQPPGFVFPKQPFEKFKIVYWSFQKSWFKEWPLLHYVEAKDGWFTLLFNKECKPHSTRFDMHTIHSVLSQ